MSDASVPRVPKSLDFIPGLYVVGGAVRNYFMDIPANDVDLASSLSPTVLKSLCKAYGIETRDVGIGFGTVLILTEEGNFEHTTFRSDKNPDGRFCEVSYVTTIEEDLARRDFTVNAMAIDREGMLVDPYGGRADCMNKVLRTVGNPTERLQEDKLRIIRGLRFMANYDLKPTSETLNAITNMTPLLCGQIQLGQEACEFRQISIERVVSEFNKAFKGRDPGYFLELMKLTGILSVILPEAHFMDLCPQNPKYHPEGDVWKHTKIVVNNAPPHLRWAALLHDIGKPETMCKPPGNTYPVYYEHEQVGADMIKRIGKRLRFSNAEINRLYTLTHLHMRPLILSRSKKVKKSTVRRFQLAAGPFLDDLKLLCRADTSGRHNSINWDLFIKQEEPIQPVLTGKVLIEKGHVPGVKFRPMLAAAYDYQLDKGCTDIEELYDVATRRLHDMENKPGRY